MQEHGEIYPCAPLLKLCIGFQLESRASGDGGLISVGLAGSESP